MTSRARPVSSKRPLSAIFIGQPSNVPDLPEPPSPGAASNGSGLPSPPATNSTGSGQSNSDENNTSAGSIHPRPPPTSSTTKTTSHTNTTTMLNGKYEKNFQAAFNGQGVEEEEDEKETENDLDEDDTARLDLRRNSRSPSENILALQRVKSLTQRNRMAIDKLSRLNSPSPNPNSRSSRSPAPPLPVSHASSSTTSSSSTSSSRISSHPPSQRRSRDLSGSETEREIHRSYSSDDLSATPPSSLSNPANLSSRPPLSPNVRSRKLSDSSNSRPRRISAPTSPGKALSRGGNSNGHTSPMLTRTPKKQRASLGQPLPVDEHRGDVTSAALAAVASMRDGGGGRGNGKKSRSALPNEFRNRRGSLEGRSSTGEPSTPYRNHDGDIYLARGSPSPKSAASSFINLNDTSPRAPRHINRSATVRERRHASRWSEDLSSRGSVADDDDDGIGRKQVLRGGSAESPINGRSLVGQGLMAAGIMKRRDSISGEDPFGYNDGVEEKITTTSKRNGVSSSLTAPTAASLAKGKGRQRDGEDWTAEDREGPRSASRAGTVGIIGGNTSTRIANEVRPPSALGRAHLHFEHGNDHDPRTPRNPPTRVGLSSLSRPTTSMAEYRLYDEPRTAPPASRGYGRSTFSSHAAGTRPGLQPQQSHLSSQDRTYSPAFGSRRNTLGPLLPTNTGPAPHQPHALANVTHSEHARLMMESLSMFESHLSRLPSMGTTPTATIPEVFRSAQNIVYASDKLNALLRAGTHRALEEQIDAEVGDCDAAGTDAAELWRRIGGEYRESLRVSDELVRTLTGFLLGVGKVLKETATVVELSPGHSRSMSLDVDGGSRMGKGSPDPGSSGRMSMDGRMSRESKRSSEHTGDVLRRLSNRADPRPGSRLDLLRDRSQSRDRPANLEDNGGGEDHDHTMTRPPINHDVVTSSSTRRLFAPREQREQRNQEQQQQQSSGMTPSDSQETVQAVEPSPTPASRQGQLDRSRTLPSVSIPKPLPSLPSESTLRRTQTIISADKNNRRKVSVTSVATVRAPPPRPMFTSLTTPNATTAVTTHTVSNSPEIVSFPISRTASGNTDSSKSSKNVTFSRSSIMSALTGLQEQHNNDTRKRTMSSDEAEETNASPQTAPKSSLSGSESERESRRRTIGTRSRVSLDGHGPPERGDVDEQVLAVPVPTHRKQRRRTLTEIFR